MSMTEVFDFIEGVRDGYRGVVRRRVMLVGGFADGSLLDVRADCTGVKVLHPETGGFDLYQPRHGMDPWEFFSTGQIERDDSPLKASEPEAAPTVVAPSEAAALVVEPKKKTGAKPKKGV
jgi:hypothetical protein